MAKNAFCERGKMRVILSLTGQTLGVQDDVGQQHLEITVVVGWAVMLGWD